MSNRLRGRVNNTYGGAIKTRLTRDLICECALETIDEVGLEAVSMRMLASALGVRASSLYYHFANRDELMTGVAEFLFRELGRPPEGGDWVAQIRAMFEQLLDFTQVHPNAAPLLIRELGHSRVAEGRANSVLGLACQAGLDQPTSAVLLGNLVALLVGHTLLALFANEDRGSWEGGNGGGQGGEYRAPWVQKVLPALAQAEPAQSRVTSGSSAFAAGLDALLRGFVAHEG